MVTLENSACTCLCFSPLLDITPCVFSMQPQFQASEPWEQIHLESHSEGFPQNGKCLLARSCNRIYKYSARGMCTAEFRGKPGSQSQSFKSPWLFGLNELRSEAPCFLPIDSFFFKYDATLSSHEAESFLNYGINAKCQYTGTERFLSGKKNKLLAQFLFSIINSYILYRSM